jgi:hypothetical protein
LHRPGAIPSLNNVVAIGGKAFTEVTEAGGAVITLAESGAGVVTTFAGSVYTVATAAAASAATGTKYAYNHPDQLGQKFKKFTFVFQKRSRGERSVPTDLLTFIRSPRDNSWWRVNRSLGRVLKEYINQRINHHRTLSPLPVYVIQYLFRQY